MPKISDMGHIIHAEVSSPKKYPDLLCHIFNPTNFPIRSSQTQDSKHLRLQGFGCNVGMVFIVATLPIIFVSLFSDMGWVIGTRVWAHLVAAASHMYTLCVGGDCQYSSKHGNITP